MNTIMRFLAVAAVALGLAAPLRAAVTISVDMDPATPGIQSTRTAAVGETLTIELVMTVDAAGVSSYGVSANFDNAELTLSGAPATTELLPAGFTYNLNAGVNSESQALGQVRTFEAATLGTGPVSTSFVIGRISFTASAPVTDGTADVTLGFFNVGVDGCFDNAGNAVAPVFVSGKADLALVVTTGTDNVAGSLRNILAAAAAQSGPDTITFDPALSGGTVTLGSEIVVNDAAGVTLDASTLALAVTIDGGTGTNRIFSVGSGTSLALKKLTLTGGNGTGTASSGNGGAIYNAGALTLTDCTLTGNVVPSGSVGGALVTTGAASSATALRCVFSSNATSGGSNGGGAIYADTSATLNCTDCTFTGNTTPNTAGAVHAIGSAVATLTRCTFTGNGGATCVYAGAVRCTGATLSLVSCTLTGNTCANSGGNGGGIFVNGGTAIVRHCTLTGNSASSGGGIEISTGTLTVENCIVAGNTVVTNGPDIYLVSGTLTRSGASVIGKNTTVTAAFPAGAPNASGDYAGTAASPVNALLAPLGSYGGPTQTLALLPASPARDHAPALLPPITADQRGFPIVGTPDIGAYEAGTFSNFNAWAIETTGTALAFGTDTDFDSASNGLEYALRRNPAASDAILSPTLTGPPGAHLFAFRYRAAARDLRYIVQRSADLTNVNNWLEIYRYDASTGVIIETGVTGDENATTEVITLTDPAPGTKVFWRLQIQQVP